MHKVSLDVPDIAELAALYRKAVEKKDQNLVGVIEAATLQVATVEAGLAEAAVLHEFAKRGVGS